MPARQSFGAFLRAKRTALGLNLREFCRRAGLDPGNLSKVERGILPPPRSEDILRTYADALKLTPADRDSLLNLAAVELQTREPVFRALRPQGRRPRPWTTAVDILQWPDFRESRAEFPRLIRRLVDATGRSIERVEFGAGEGSERHGWDGIVVAAEKTVFVPAGLSVWELGTSRDPAEKARRAFRDALRRADKLGVDKADAVFVFVTPRRWEGKKSWEQKQNDKRNWKDVRVYDVDDLEAWLELAPSVDIWFARLIGKRPEGMQDVDEHWDNLSALTVPNLKPDLFLVSRDEDVNVLENWLAAPPSVLAVEARSPAESIDFLAAHLASLTDEKRDAITSRVVIVETREAWRSLIESPNSLTLVAKPNVELDPESTAQAVRHGHRVLLSSHHFAPGMAQPPKLSRPNVYDLERALKECGFEETDAVRCARDCGGSLTVLKRLLPGLPSTAKPTWSQDAAAHDLALLALLGCWDDTFPGDLTILERLTGRAYSEVVADVQRWTALPDPPLMRVLSQWHMTSREDSWLLLARYLTQQNLETFEALAIDVLSADDPQFELPPDNRRWARMAGTLPKYSNTLRTGISETFALLATRGNCLESQATDQSFRVNRVVEAVLGGNPGWQRWSSLDDQLPTLTEAAPDTFIASVQFDLEQANPALPKLLEDSGDPFFAPCLHAGLLRALETLAWSPRFLKPVSLRLAELAECDRGTRWHNRPANSLVQIFLQTTASVEQRIKVLEKVTREHPEVGWKLQLSLLPKDHDSADNTRRPVWRDWASTWKERASNADYWRQVEACSERLLEMAGSDPQRWLALIEQNAELPPRIRAEAIARLQQLNVQEFSQDDRAGLAEALRRQIDGHCDDMDVDGALPADDIQRLQEARSHVEPDDPVARHAWLFANWPDLSGWVDEYEAELSRQRQRALQDLISRDGFAALVLLVLAAEDPGAVGEELAALDEAASIDRVIPVFLEDVRPALVTFARGYARGCFKLRGGDWTWVESLLTVAWTDRQIASLLLGLPREMSAWKLVERHGEEVCRMYWEAVPDRVRDSADFEYAVSKLVQHGRPFSAAHVVTMALHCKVAVDAPVMLCVLETRLDSEYRLTKSPSDGAGRDLQELFRSLQFSDGPVEWERLARLEWAYLDILDGHPARPHTLYKLLAADPKQFVEVLRVAWPSIEQTDDAIEQMTANETQRMQHARRLLGSWDVLPGFDEETQSVNEFALSEWVTRARIACQESGYAEIGDVQIGRLLAHAPPEPDGSWPCVPARDVIEDAESDALDDGLLTGRLNKRGAVNRSPFSGGDLEQELSREYAEYTDACEIEWQRTADILRRISQHYEYYARRKDEEAEARRLGRWG